MIGQHIGNYKIEAKLGEGGMGTVYKGVDTMIDREVAIKVLRPELARQTEIVERFRGEAVTLAKLNHPNIASLYTMLRQGDELYMVLEFVPGTTLDTVMERRGAIPAVEAIPVFCQVLDGIDHAHELGIVHRDIKPSNMMFNEKGVLKVLDFGIARLLGSSRMTREGSIIGTLEYMSPEQITGLETDGRSDIYALGMMLYEILTAQLAFSSDNEFALMKMQTEETPRPPRKINPNIPESVEVAIMKAIQKDPALRFQTCGDFRQNLLDAGFSAKSAATLYRREPVKDVVAVEPQVTEQPSHPSPIGENVGQTPPAAVAPRPMPVPSTIEAIEVAAIPIETPEQKTDAKGIASLFVLNGGSIHGLLSVLAWSAVGGLAGLLSFGIVMGAAFWLNVAPYLFGLPYGVALFFFGEYSGGIKIRRLNRLYRFIVLAAGSIIGFVLAANLFSTNDSFVGAFLFGVGLGLIILVSQLAAWRLPVSKLLYSFGLVINSGFILVLTAFIFDMSNLATFLYFLPVVCFLIGACTLAVHAIFLSGNRSWSASTSFTGAFIAIVVFSIGAGRSFDAQTGNTNTRPPTNSVNAVANAANVALAPGWEPTARERADKLAAEASELYKSKRYAEAAEKYAEGIKLAPKDHDLYNGLGNSLFEQKKFVEAENSYRKAVELYPQKSIFHHNLGLSLNGQRRYADAIESFKEAIQLDPYDDDPHNGLGNSYFGQGKYAEAATEFRKAIKIAPQFGVFYGNLGNALYEQKLWSEAITAYREAVRLNAADSTHFNRLGNAYYTSSRYPDAEAAYKEAVRLSPGDAVMQNNLGGSLYKQSKYDAAIAAYKKAIALDPQNEKYKTDLTNAESRKGFSGR
jgi:serine/threonine protein kinase/tetratricopeptide (TPR) repeat protein